MNCKAGLCWTPLSKWASLPLEVNLSLGIVNVPSPVLSHSPCRQASNGLKFTRAGPEAQITWTLSNLLVKKQCSKWCDNQRAIFVGEWFFASFDRYLQMKYKWSFCDHIFLLRSAYANPGFLQNRVAMLFHQTSYCNAPCWSVPEVKSDPETESSLGNLGGVNVEIRIYNESPLLSLT